MTELNRLSLHIRNSAPASDVLAFATRYQPRVLLVMDDDTRCVQLADTCPDTLIIQRRWSAAEGSQWDARTPGYMSPHDYAVWLTLNGGMDHRIAVQVLNEAHAWGDDITTLCDWLIATGRELTAMGYRAVLGNIGPAIYAPEVIESGRFDNYLRYLHEESLKPNGHLGGWHAYTFAFLPFGAGLYTVDDLRHPERLQPPWPDIDGLQIQAAREALRAAHHEDPDMRWPYPSDDVEHKPYANWWLAKPDDDETAQVVYPPWWHLFREQWFRLYAESVGIGWHEYVLSEGLWDDMPDLGPTHIKEDLTAAYGIPANIQGQPYKGLRGPLTLQNVWREYWPDWTPEQAAYEQWIWFHRNLEDACLGMTAFTVSNDEWNYDWGYNLMLWPAFLELLISNRTMPRFPEPPPDEPPDDGGPGPDPAPPVDWSPVFLALLLFSLACNGVLLAVVIQLTQVNQSIGVQAMPTYQLMEVDTFGKMLIAIIVSVGMGGITTLAATPIINVVKYLLQLVGWENKVGANAIKIAVGTVIMVIYWVLRWRGVSIEQFGQWDQLVANTVSVLAGWLALTMGSSALHTFAVNHNGPKAYSYQRSEPAQTADKGAVPF
jgi:hypothetical protein